MQKVLAVKVSFVHIFKKLLMKEAPQKFKNPFKMDQIEHYFATFLIFKRKLALSLSLCPSSFFHLEIFGPEKKFIYIYEII